MGQPTSFRNGIQAAVLTKGISSNSTTAKSTVAGHAHALIGSTVCAVGEVDADGQGWDGRVPEPADSR